MCDADFGADELWKSDAYELELKSDAYELCDACELELKSDAYGLSDAYEPRMDCHQCH